MYRIFTYIHNFPTFPLQSSRNIKLTNSKYSQICTDCRKYGKYWSNFGAGRMYVHSPARHVTSRENIGLEKEKSLRSESTTAAAAAAGIPDRILK